MALFFKKSTTLYCFSPPVMVATFVFEFFAALFVVWKYKLNTALRLVVTILTLLGVFQVAEYFVCGGIGVNARGWSRIGYVAITALPPLGLHLISVIANKKPRFVVGSAYVSMAGFMGYFIAAPGAFLSHQCTGNYVIFQLSSTSGKLYYAFYYSVLMVGIFLALKWSSLANSSNGLTAKRRYALRAMILGYSVFMIPTAIANTINPATKRGIPSIMCGFAVLFAIILFTHIAPRVASRKVNTLIKLQR